MSIQWKAEKRRKEKWEKEQLHGDIKQQIGDIVRVMTWI